MTATLYNPASPPVRGSAWTFDVVLYSQADTKLIQTSVTLAAGDVLIYLDGVLDGNIDTLPVEIGTSGVLPVALSAAEMTADRVMIKFADAAGAQWVSAAFEVFPVSAVSVGTSDLVAGDAMTLSSGAITAAVIATGAIDADAIADGAIDAGAIADGAIDAATFAAGAINAAAIATGAIDADALATDAVAEIADGVWDEAQAGHTTAATFGKYLDDEISDVDAAVWGYTAGRTLTQASTSTADTSSTGAIRRTRGDSWTITITDLPTLTGYTSIWFTLKDKKSQADTESRLQIKKNATGLSDGLLYVNGAAASDSTKGSITVASTTSITIAVDPTITDDMPADWLGYYDVQTLISTVDNTPEAGAFEVTADVTRAIA